MPDAGISRKVTPSLAAAAPDLTGAFAREVRDSTAQLRAFFSAAGFGDLPDNGSLVLWEIISGVESMAEMAATLGITEQEVDATIKTLVRHGFLDHQDVPTGHGRPRLAPTERARMVTGGMVSVLRRTRWANFPFRRGDIVICSPPKSGNTWVQAICAFLIFQTPELPASMSELSVWLDDPGTLRDEVYAQLAAQQHRRIIKAHVPLNDIPIAPQATYIAVGRHPLDVALSMYHQLAQLGQGGLASPHDELLHMFDMGSSPRIGSLAMMLRDLSAAWARRSDPNLVLVHYEDLCADLEGEMRRLAARLGITVPEVTWPILVKAATFKQMRAKADRFVPVELRLRDRVTFFRSGISGEGRALFTDAELARYHACTAQLAPPELLAWLHRDEGPHEEP